MKSRRLIWSPRLLLTPVPLRAKSPTIPGSGWTCGTSQNQNKGRAGQLLQHAVAERVRALGWQQVEIINSDLGSSAGLATAEIADEQQVYDLNNLDDQLVLGIKGTLSVVELKVMRVRLVVVASIE